MIDLQMQPIHKWSLTICLIILLITLSLFFMEQGKPTLEPVLQDEHEHQLKEERLPSLEVDLHADYYIEARLIPAQHLVQGEATITFDRPPTSDLRFYSYAYEWQPMQIKGVFQELEAGAEALPYRYDQRTIFLDLDDLQGEEGRIKLKIAFQTPIPVGGTRMGVKDSVWLLTNWHPQLAVLDHDHQWKERPRPRGFGDPFYYSRGQYEVSLSAPAAYQWVTSGVEQGEVERKTEGEACWHWTGTGLHNFALVGSPQFFTEDVRLEDGTVIRFAALSLDHLARLMETGLETFMIYSDLFGSLPGKQFGVVESSTGTNYAIEHPNLAIVSRDMFSYDLLQHWLPHEMAHWWWYNNLGTWEVEQGWLDEGLAEMSVYFYTKFCLGEEKAEHLYKEYQRSHQTLMRLYPHSHLGESLAGFADHRHFNTSWYGGSAMLFLHLAEEMDEGEFFHFLRLLTKEYGGMYVDARHLDEALGSILHGTVNYFVKNVEAPNYTHFSPPDWESEPAILFSAGSPMLENEEPFTATAFVRNGQLYLPLRPLLEYMGAEVSWDGAEQMVRVRDVLIREADEADASGKAEVITMLIPMADRTLTIQGTAGTHSLVLASSPLNREGILYLPVDFFEAIYGWKVLWDKEANQIIVGVERDETVMLQD